MASHCGWTHDYIADNFTFQQLQIYYKFIQIEKQSDLRNNAIVFSQAVGYGNGYIKKEDFQEFIDLLVPNNKIKEDEQLNKMREMGIIEEN